MLGPRSVAWSAGTQGRDGSAASGDRLTAESGDVPVVVAGRMPEVHVLMACASGIARRLLVGCSSVGRHSFCARPDHYHTGGRDIAGPRRNAPRGDGWGICLVCCVSVATRAESSQIRQNPATRRWQGSDLLNYLSCSGALTWCGRTGWRHDRRGRGRIRSSGKPRAAASERRSLGR